MFKFKANRSPDTTEEEFSRAIACAKTSIESVLYETAATVSEKALTESDTATLHRIRTLGNQAAHDATPNNVDQLSLALDICEHLLKGIYLTPQHVENNLKQAT